MAKKKENVTEEIKVQESTVKAPVKKAAAKKVKESEAKTHREADIENEEALKALKEANNGLALGLPVDLIQVDVTRCWQLLGEITGEAAPDELITQLFSQFCLGK